MVVRVDVLQSNPLMPLDPRKGPRPNTQVVLTSYAITSHAASPRHRLAQALLLATPLLELRSV